MALRTAGRRRRDGQEFLEDTDGDRELSVALVVVIVVIRSGIHLDDHTSRVGERDARVARDQIDAGEPNVESTGGAGPVLDDRRAELTGRRRVVVPAVLVDHGLEPD